MKTYKCPHCCGSSSFDGNYPGALHCRACDPASNVKRWTVQLQESVRAVEFYMPDDLGNPAKGMWVILGPTSEMTTSANSMEHAALMFLANVCKDDGALTALRRSTERPPPAE